MRRLLKKLRRAAGAVRDLDVQQDLVKQEVSGYDGEGVAERGMAGTGDLEKEVSVLGRRLKKRRDREAKALVALLERLRGKLTKRMKALLDALEAGEDVELPEAGLLTIVQKWYGSRTKGDMREAAGDPDEADRLHSIRKVAKLARYLAETAPEGARRAHTLAARFEGIQEAGGQWHDWMILSQVAAGELGEAAALPQRFAMHAANALADFRAKLVQTRLG